MAPELPTSECSSANAAGDEFPRTGTYVPADRAEGAVIAGRYKLLEVIGEGGMGEVWSAEQVEPIRRRVAVKVIKLGMDSRQVLARFEAERQALALMDHPHIAKVLDAGTTTGGRPYFVMELVRGVPITTYCDRHKLTTRERLELFVSVCQAIQHAHHKGIIHRDVKPSNILVESREGRPSPKVIDFGVSKATAQPLTDLTLNTGFGTVVGTLAYMAPEQAGADSADVDTRADVYALGVVLYELLTGSTPFDPDRLKKAGLDEVVRVIREEDPPRPSTKISTADTLPSLAANRATDPIRLMRLLRGDIEWVVMKCLEKDRDRRYETANALAIDLQRYLGDEPVLARAPTLGYRVRKFVRRNRGAVLAASLVLLALLGGITGTTWGLFEARRQRDEAEQARSDEATQRKLAETNAAEAKRQQAEANKQRTEAQQQANIAYYVKDFLQRDLLGQASPRRQGTPTSKPDPDLTVKAALDRAAARIAGRFDKQPLVEAEIRRTIGWAYRDLGDLQAAQPQFERALDLWRKAKGADDRTTIDMTTDLSMFYRIQGKYPLAEPLAVQAVDAARRTLGENDPITLRASGALANLLVAQGKDADAEKLLVHLVRVGRERLGPEDPQTLVFMVSLGTVYKELSRHADAVELYEKVLSVRERTLGKEHLDTLSVMNNLAIVHKLQGDYAKARPLYEQILEIRRRVLGVEHGNTLGSMNNLALLLKELKEYGRAEKLLTEALSAAGRKLGEDHPISMSILDNLATVLYAQRRHVEAEPLFEKVVLLRRKKLGEDHHDTLTALHGLALVYAARGKRAEAEAAYEKVVAGRRVAGPDHPFLANALVGMAGDRLDQNKHAEAEPLLREAVAILQKLPDDVERLATQFQLGRSLLGQKKYAEAESVLRQCYDGLKEREAKFPNRVKIYLTPTVERLVELYTAWDKPEEAARWRKALEAIPMK